MPTVSWKTGAYKLSNLLNGKVYVGGAYKSFVQRIRLHYKSLNSGRHFNRHLQAAWNKYGAKAFRFSILERCSPAKVKDVEQKWMDHYQSADPRFGYNLSPTAGSTLGVKKPPESMETRAKRSQTMKGRAKSEEHKKKISEALMGKKKSAQAIANFSAAVRGRKLSKEHREAISRASTLAQSGQEYRDMMAEKIRGKKRTPEQIKRAAAARRGKKLSAEACRNMSKARLGKPNNWLGRKHTEETKEKIRIASLKREAAKRNYLDTGSTAGLVRAETLFGELE